jgi:glycosyltransferase involved in cell wall biosynthesis
MHIALIHHHVGGKAGGGGGVRLMLELGLGLQRRGHRVTIACHDHLPDSEFLYASEQLEIRSVRTGSSDGVPDAPSELARRYWLDMPKVARLVPDDVDVINAHEWLALRPGRIAAGRLKVPLVWTRNDESIWERAIVPRQTIVGDTGRARRVFRLAVGWPDLLDARRADAIAVLSQEQVGMVRRSYRKDASVVAFGPPGHFFDPPERKAARERLGIPGDRFVVLGSGILVTHRRFEDLIEAMALLEDPQVHALISGSDHVDPAYADRMAALIARHRLGDRVSLPRRAVSDAEMKDMLVAADVFVISSQRYAWGLAPLEAIASGTPVILTPGAGVYDILAGRPGIQVVPREDPRALAGAIRAWRSGAARAEVEPTRAWLREEYALDRYVERMEQMYEGVLRGG